MNLVILISSINFISPLTPGLKKNLENKISLLRDLKLFKKDFRIFIEVNRRFEITLNMKYNKCIAEAIGFSIRRLSEDFSPLVEKLTRSVLVVSSILISRLYDPYLNIDALYTPFAGLPLSIRAKLPWNFPTTFFACLREKYERLRETVDLMLSRLLQSPSLLRTFALTSLLSFGVLDVGISRERNANVSFFYSSLYTASFFLQ